MIGAVTAIVVVVAIVLIDSSLELTAIGLRLLLVFASLALGDTVRSRRALRAAAQERANREQREREDEARQPAVEERLRIARELHDTLAHSLVAINVRAGVALDLDDSQDPSGALRDIKQVSATALHDLRATLGVLRDQADAAPTAPASDLDALAGLADRARSAGLHTDVDVQVNGVVVPFGHRRGGVPDCPRGVDQRVAPRGRVSARVGIRARSDTLDIEITDVGTPTPPA